ncbi:MAG: hypothetical protein K0M67_21490 [Thiobacillus sp.]|nr:hypothetical protein [Thiobacillus sp.]
MTRAKPRYDGGGGWKLKQYTEEQWTRIEIRVSRELASFCPVKNASEDELKQWVHVTLSEASDALGTMYWHTQRLTNEELRAERQDLLKVLREAHSRLSSVSHDLELMLAVGADVLGTRDKLVELMRFVEMNDAAIDQLPRARRAIEIRHEAALEMAVRVLRVFKEYGGDITATADTDRNYISDSVQILRIVGEALGLPFDPTTWKQTLTQARKSSTDLQER